MTTIHSPATPADSTVPAPSRAPLKEADGEDLTSLFNTAESRLNKVLGQTTAQRVQRVGLFAALVAVAGAVMAYRRMQK